MGIQLEFYVILLMWLSMLGSNQITGGIIGNSFFQFFMSLGVTAGVVALFGHVVEKKISISDVKWEDKFHFLSLMIFFVGFYCAMEHIRRRGDRETEKNESDKFKGNTSQNN